MGSTSTATYVSIKLVSATDNMHAFSRCTTGWHGNPLIRRLGVAVGKRWLSHGIGQRANASPKTLRDAAVRRAAPVNGPGGGCSRPAAVGWQARRRSRRMPAQRQQPGRHRQSLRDQRYLPRARNSRRSCRHAVSVIMKERANHLGMIAELCSTTQSSNAACMASGTRLFDTGSGLSCVGVPAYG